MDHSPALRPARLRSRLLALTILAIAMLIAVLTGPGNKASAFSSSYCGHSVIYYGTPYTTGSLRSKYSAYDNLNGRHYHTYAHQLYYPSQGIYITDHWAQLVCG